MIESEYLKNLVAKAKKLQKTIVLPEGEDERILKAAHIIAEEEAANLVILGDETEIKNYFAQNNWSMNRPSVGTFSKPVVWMRTRSRLTNASMYTCVTLR